MNKSLSALRLARSASLLVAVVWAGSAAAIDTLALQSPPDMAADARGGGQGRDATTARQPGAGSGAPVGAANAGAEPAETAGDYQPHMLALAGALLMGYIGLRRPRE